ncbi:NmrA family NAD(P)-binding protein [Tabrizicola oligotrophica]|uniref:NAD(P)H-binding protein n=1 Tax=Tabrizicola oligotrophica TaxID=2710650 RepID=A0A6M0QYJ1_9RHOB|nr:NAD(P)H-binding protein [Tabrizicola oligotrophica]NEY91903.1 NAD(P)H-binding protein [Tabrizicola oligotrophica]
MTIAITGATGQLGRLAIAALKARGAAPVALARSPEKAADLGVAVRAFDYARPDAAALDGIETLVLISSNDFTDRVGQHKAVIAAAKAAGVGHVIYTSILKGEKSPMLLAADHIGTEAALKASGLPHTLLRNGWYTENYTGSLGAALAHGGMAGAAGAGRVSTAARADYAEAIAVVALDKDHQGKVHELAGDEAYQLADMAAEVSRQSGKTIGYSSLPEADYAAMLIGFGLPEGFSKALADSDAQAAQGALFDDSRSLSQLIGRPTTPMGATVRAALA